MVLKWLKKNFKKRTEPSEGDLYNDPCVDTLLSDLGFANSQVKFGYLGSRLPRTKASKCSSSKTEFTAKCNFPNTSNICAWARDKKGKTMAEICREIPLKV